MRELDELLSHAERALEDGFTGRAAESRGVGRARARIRRRRAARQVTQGVGAVAAVGLVVAGAWLVSGHEQRPAPALTSTATDSPIGPTTSPTAGAAQSGSPSTAAEVPTGAGCPAGGGGIPPGAAVTQIVDVDGDGLPDRAWWDGNGNRQLGVTTASGATFSIWVDDASPIAGEAIVQLIQSDHVPIVLVDLHRDARLYSLAGCAITPVLNAQGDPYTFDRGYGIQGTGVGCTQVGGTLRLAGLDAVRNADGTYDVSRTFIDLDTGGRHATNEKRVVVARGAAADSPVVVTAQEVSCGDLLAGRDGPNEP